MTRTLARRPVERLSPLWVWFPSRDSLVIVCKTRMAETRAEMDMSFSMSLIKIKAMGRKQFVGHFEALKCPNFRSTRQNPNHTFSSTVSLICNCSSWWPALTCDWREGGGERKWAKHLDFMASRRGTEMEVAVGRYCLILNKLWMDVVFKVWRMYFWVSINVPFLEIYPPISAIRFTLSAIRFQPSS